MEDADKLYVSLYNKLDSETPSVAERQWEVKLPKIEGDQSEEEQKDDKKKHNCHYHGRAKKKDKDPKATTETDEPEQSIVSQIVFSSTLQWMALLISGPINGIVVINLKDPRNDVVQGQVWFTNGQSSGTELQTIARMVNPTQGYGRMKLERPIYPQVATRIQFSANMSELTVSGPDRHFAFYKISNPKITKMVKNEYPFV